MGSIRVSIDTGSVRKTKSSIKKSRVSLSSSLAIVVSNNWGVHKSTSSGAKAHISAGFLLLNSEGRDKSGNLVVGSSNGLISSNSNWDRVTSNYGSSRDNSSSSI